MRTIRGRLAAGYALALAATMFVFAASILFLERSDTFGQLDARLRVEADLTANIIQSIPPPIVEEDSSTGAMVLSRRVGALLQSVEDYLLVIDAGGNVLYAESPVASVQVAGQTIRITSGDAANAAATTALFEALADIARTPEVVETFGSFDPGGRIEPLRYYVRQIAVGPGVASVLAAAPTAGTGVAPRRLFMGILVSGPLILAASVSIGFVMAGRVIKPVDAIIDEIEAITDGRSLHRRVAEVRSTEELARLTTTLNNMLVRLERNFLSLRRFTADASHELKTPLTVLRSGIERAITHPAAPPNVLEVLEETLVEVNRMTELVDALLMLARADEGRAPLHLETIDIGELLTEVAETANILGEQASVTVEVEVPRQPIVVPIDRSRIRQLFMNLLSNAVKYTPRGGHVRIDCRLDGTNVVFVVHDTGIGIPSSELPYIFDRFWRADVARSRTGQRPGVGLGLAICKWIAEAHGGSIRAESRRGKGSTFTVTLPVTDEAAPP